jgi:hypothetical protein
VISTPSASAPTTRGNDISFSASASVTVSSDIDLKSEAVRGLTAFFPVLGVSSGSTSVTYGPYRPAFATIGWPLSGSTPSSKSPLGLASSSSAYSVVSSSGASSSGTSARWWFSASFSPRSTYGP